MTYLKLITGRKKAYLKVNTQELNKALAAVKTHINQNALPVPDETIILMQRPSGVSWLEIKAAHNLTLY